MVLAEVDKHDMDLVDEEAPLIREIQEQEDPGARRRSLSQEQEPEPESDSASGFASESDLDDADALETGTGSKGTLAAQDFHAGNGSETNDGESEKSANEGKKQNGVVMRRLLY